MKREELEEMHRGLENQRTTLGRCYTVDDLIIQVHKCKELGLTPTQHKQALGLPRKFVLALWEYVFLDLPEDGVRASRVLVSRPAADAGSSHCPQTRDRSP